MEIYGTAPGKAPPAASVVEICGKARELKPRDRFTHRASDRAAKADIRGIRVDLKRSCARSHAEPPIGLSALSALIYSVLARTDIKSTRSPTRARRGTSWTQPHQK